MQAIRSAMRRFLIVANLHVVRDALLRMCRKQAPPPIQPSETAAETVDEGEPYAEVADPEESFAAWEAERNEKLHQVQDYEQQGLRLLGKAALLRAAIKCDDRGETFIAEELREQAEASGGESLTEVPSDTWDTPTLRIVGVDEVLAQPGA